MIINTNRRIWRHISGVNTSSSNVVQGFLHVSSRQPIYSPTHSSHSFTSKETQSGGHEFTKTPFSLFALRPWAVIHHPLFANIPQDQTRETLVCTGPDPAPCGWLTGQCFPPKGDPHSPPRPTSLLMPLPTTLVLPPLRSLISFFASPQPPAPSLCPSPPASFSSLPSLVCEVTTQFFFPSSSPASHVFSFNSLFFSFSSRHRD